MRVHSLWLVSLIALVPQVGNAALPQPSVVAMNVVSDPGPPPPFDADEYAKYRRQDGSAAVEGAIPVSGPFGGRQDCSGATAALYPNTPYTRWMIEKWARMVDGRKLDLSALWPGDRDTNMPVPSFLMPDAYHDSSKAVQVGACDSLNTVRFNNVVAGRYYLVVMTTSFVGSLVERQGQAIAQTPYGEIPVPINEGYEARGHRGDGYVYVSRRELIVEAGHSYTMAPDNIIAVAHVLAKQ